MLRSLVLLIAIEFLAAPAVHPQESVASRLVPPVEQGDYSLSSLLLLFAEGSNVPVGFEVSRDRNDTAKQYMGTKANVSLRNLLNETVGSDTPYEWKENEGVIDVFPKRREADVFDRQVGPFEASNSHPIEMVQQLLEELVLSKYFSKQDTIATTWITGSVTPNRYSVSFGKTSFREALNKIAVATGRLGWIAFYQSQNGKSYLYFQLW